MKHIIAKYSISLLMAVAMAAAAGCSHGISFDIEGELADKAASQVYLIVEKTTADTIATAAVGSDFWRRVRCACAPTSSTDM